MKILNFGSINKDFVYEVKDFVSQGETIESLTFKEFLGGKGLNQSVAVARAKMKIYHAGCINRNDENIKNQLENWGVETRNICCVDKPTGHAIIQVNNKGDNSIIIHGGANRKISLEHIDKTISKFDVDDILLIQNEINNIPELIERASSQKMKIIFNPAPFTEDILNYPLEKIDTIIYNEIEGRGLSGKTTIEEIKGELLEKFQELNHIITLGDKGSIYFDNKDEISVDAIKAETIDSTAAGDTYIGYYLASITNKMTVKDSMVRASRAAGITTEKLGGAISIPHID